MTSIKRFEKICSYFKEKQVLVFGDVILDRYVFGSVSRISPEAPVPVVKVEKEECRAGGAGNVASNIFKLGSRCILMGITGDDSFADEISSIDGYQHTLYRTPENQTLVKTRIISQRQQIVRVDRERLICVSPEIEQNIIQDIGRFGKELHGIIISDYAKGTLTLSLMECLKSKAKELGIPILVDPKPANYYLYKGIDGITPNRSEAEAAIRGRIETDEEAEAAIKILRRRFKTRFSMITRGDKGITAGEQGKHIFHLPAFAHEVFDVTGAGDTVVAVLMLGLISGASLKEAAALANTAASIVVERIGASQITMEEFLQRIKLLYGD